MSDKEDRRIVLNFYESLLRKSDVALLEPGQWLNDNLIGFMFEYFEHVEFRDGSKDLLFLSPGVTQLIKLTRGVELMAILEPLNLPKYQRVFFAVNNNEVKMSTGGSHWSLLVYCKRSNIFSHYDSLSEANSNAAKELANQVGLILKDPGPSYEEALCPQQENGSDCGVYVIGITEHLCKQCTGETTVKLIDAVTPAAIARRRQQMKELIVKLAKAS
ncbi:sentrin-specific protease 8 [Nematostella vectensis]|uniref:sentrin-specific protease 8 n=1 Tax=Nematostella vectensis TaxID=45351 RepID=UPI002076D5AD|nr:sentrin-specific protease 8 [Nematostella vectensis]